MVREELETIKDLSRDQFVDVYQAVECLGKSGKLFSFHDNPNPNCPIGANIHAVLDQKLFDVCSYGKPTASDKSGSGCSHAQNKLSKYED